MENITMDDNYFLQNSSNNEIRLNSGYAELQIETSRLRIGILASYLVTMVLGLIGNGLVIYIIGRNSQIRNKSVANYYIWNLAFADLMFLLTMPFFCYSTYYNTWPFGTVACKMAAAFKETMRYTSMLTLVALSFDRYLASFYNMTHLRTIKVGIAVCCATWVMCGSIAVPYAMYARLQRNQCKVILPSDTIRVFMAYFQLVSALVIPLLLICMSYTLLALRLRVILHSSAISSASVQRPNRKMTRTVLVVIITFIIWQTPYHVNNIINIHKQLKMSHTGTTPTVHEILVSMYFTTISTILVFISSCCNPIIYGLLNDNYRKLYVKTLCCCCCKTANGSTRSFAASRSHSKTQGQFGWHCPCLLTGSSTNACLKVQDISMATGTVNTEHIPLGESSAEGAGEGEL